MRTRNEQNQESFPGLCLDCVLALTAAAPPEPANPHQSGGWSALRKLWLTWPRCAQCPTYFFDSVRFPPELRNSKLPNCGLCKWCAEDCRAELNRALPYPPRANQVFAALDTREDRGLWLAYYENSLLLGEEFGKRMAQWPRCPECPGLELPVRQKEAARVGDAVVEALAAHRTLSSAELLGLGIKGLTKNTMARIMGDLVSAERIRLMVNGTSKSYALV